MIPRLYPANETAFTNHGYGALSDAISCIVPEERNGPYELLMTYPITGLHYSDLALQRIILAKPNFTDDPQPFRIYKITKPLNGIVTIYGQHISYDLSGVIIQTGTAGNALAAMQVLQNAAPGWNITTDKSVTANWKVLEPSSVRSWFGGKEGSILDVFGPGEWKYDKFTCSFLTSRGSNRGVEVRYAKNLTELSQEIDCSNLVKYVLGYYKDVDGNIVSGTLQDTGCMLTDKQLAVDFSSDFEEVPTQAAIDARTQQYIAANNFTAPTDNIKLDFAQLGTLTDRVDLCDTIKVYYEALGVSTTAKCIRTTWDVLRERYTEIEVGDAKPSILDTMTEISEKTVSGVINFSQIYNAIENATSAITGNTGGYVVLHDSNADGHPDELLIMDTPDIATATKVWRWNSGGLGYSSTGYAGTYATAITSDGKIVADFITTGTINAAQVNVINIDASKITVGTLDAARIAAGSITVAQLAEGAQSVLMTGSSSKTQYYLSTSESSATGGSWQDTVPTWSSGKYIWTRVSTTKTFADGTSSTTTSTAVYDRALTTALSTASSAQSTADSASTAASNAQTTANGANSQEQLIYASKVSGTTSLSGTTTWVTDVTGGDNKWTLKRPKYNSSYPVLFVATQRKTVGGTVTCTTPQIDDTTTVIDGGHITTGTIDASVVNVIKLNASNITTGTLTGITITGSTLISATSSGSVRIKDGGIDFFKDATTTGTPFSQIKHVTDSQQGDSIEWSNSGYTKLVNTGGGQWTADFVQFALGASNPQMQMQIYSDSDGTHTKVLSNFLNVNGQLWLTKTGGGDNAAVRIRASSYVDSCVSLKNTVTDREIELLLGSGGVNRGIYIRDANMSGWLLYYDDANLNITKPVAFSYPAQTRSNLGIGCTSLWSGSQTSGSFTVANAGAYNFLIVGGSFTNNYALTTVFIPVSMLSGTETQYILSDDVYYCRFGVTLSGTTATISIKSLSGSGSYGRLSKVFGVI